MSRTKGQAGEREAAILLTTVTGCTVRRRVRQHDGDSDLEGVPGWAVEVKRHAACPPALLAAWWQQACEQAARIHALPLLVFRADRAGWRCRWPAALHAAAGHELTEADTLEGDLPTWWQLVRTHGQPQCHGSSQEVCRTGGRRRSGSLVTG